MPDPVYFSKVKLIDGTLAEVKDEVARSAIAGGVTFVGVTTTELTDGQTISSVTIGGSSRTLKNGDLVMYGSKEFIFASADGKVHEFGDTTGLGSLAFKNNATGSFTPAGTISKPNITVTPSNKTVKEIKTGGSVTNGTANTPTAVTLPTFAATLNGEILELSWTPGSVTPGTANTPTAVTLPTTQETTVLGSVSAALAGNPTFTGTAGTVTVS